MSNNTAKQTLFRFVSLRNPQLTKTKPEENLGFIHRPTSLTSDEFDIAIDAWYSQDINTRKTKLATLEQKAISVASDTNYYKKEEDIKDAFGEYIKLGEALLKGETFDEETISELDNIQLKKLWSNLIFQVITQKDFYIKEAIVQSLKANHYIKYKNQENVENLKTAKIVLPSYLFVDDYDKNTENQQSISQHVFTVNESQISGAYIATNPYAKKLSAAAKRKLSNLAQKNQETTIAKSSKTRLENLKAELEKVSSFYQQEYKAALTSAQEANDLLNKEVLKNNRLQRLQVESTFTEETNEAAKIFAIESIDFSELTPLEFSFRKEVNAKDLQSKLSPTALKTLSELIGIVTEDVSNFDPEYDVLNFSNGTKVVLPQDEYQTYTEINQLIDTKLKTCTDIIIANTETQTESVLSIGGAVISQQKTSSASNGSYVLTAKSHNLDINTGSLYRFYYNPLIYCDFDLLIDTMEVIESMEITVTNTNGLTYNYYPSYFPKNGTITTISDIFFEQFEASDFGIINGFYAKVFFVGGKQATIELNQSFSLSTPYPGVLKFISDETELLPCTYQACTNLVSGNNYNIQLSLEMPNADLDVTSVLYTLKDTSGSRNTNGYFDKSKNGNLIILNNLMGVGGVPAFNNSKLEVSINLSDGEKIDFETPILSLGGCVNGDFTIERPKQNPTASTTVVNADSFIPKGFGIKRLGIADYLKVEQSLHAYVPGEVSHIENIMAREYKEKSTRRLRKQETTNTTSTDTEREKLTDTTSASRFEMQSEISKMLQESTDFGVNANMQIGNSNWGFQMNIGANYAHHQAKEESQRQAVTQSQDITTRALDRIVTKVHEERIEKIIEEYEENNKHGFDNTKGDKHVVGVYRWLDKRMKNQIYNYGKRMMFEFMIPEPARLHTLALNNLKNKNTKVIPIPVDPRTSSDFQMKDYTALSNEDTLKYWISKYNVELENKLSKNLSIGKSYSGMQSGNISLIEFFNVKDEIQIPENYSAKSGLVGFTATEDGAFNSIGFSALIGDKNVVLGGQRLQGSISQLQNFEREFSNSIPVSATFSNYFTGTANFTINCEIKQEYEAAWQQKAFNAIIQAYEDAMSIYNSQLEQEEAKAKQISSENPNYYRQIEQEILKHNAIAFLTDDEFEKNEKLGLDLNEGKKGVTQDMKNYLVKRDYLDQYAALVKFMEQAFEWDIMSYHFYPYYWAGRSD